MDKRVRVNEYEEMARLKKALAIEGFCLRVGLTAEDMEQVSANFWLTLAKIIGIRPPSKRTQDMVLELLRNRETNQRREENPFPKY
ncbi:MAG: hypothetical protein V2G41_09770 [bacterium JZ-2024 1]